MKTYFVTLQVIIGEHEKVTHKLVQASSDSEAGTYAVFAETHHTDTMEWGEDCQDATDAFGAMVYSVNSAEEVVTLQGVANLAHFLTRHTYNQADLDKAGDYKDKI